MRPTWNPPAAARAPLAAARDLLAALADLLLPAACGGCGAAAGGWCPACDDTLNGPRTARPARAGPVVAAGRYRGPLRRALLGYKERGRRDLAPALARLLVPAVAAVLPVEPGPVWLVPAPSRRSAARARGGDHVLRLCRALAVRLAAAGLEVHAVPVLTLARPVRDSVGLDPAQRAANLDGAVRARPDRLPAATGPPGPGGVRVLLVDDVVTTGATLAACREALRDARIPVHAAVVLCDATGRRRPVRTVRAARQRVVADHPAAAVRSRCAEKSARRFRPREGFRRPVHGGDSPLTSREPRHLI